MGTRSVLRTTLLALPMLAVTAAVFAGGGLPAAPARLAALALIYAAFNAAFILTVHTGKTDRWRAPVYISCAFLFAVSFLGNLLELSSTPGYTADFLFKAGAPICHIALPMLLLPAAITRTLLWPGSVSGSYASAASVLVAWLGASLALGRGWCSWGCFFGGFEDGFSRILPAPVIKDPPKWLLNLPLALLIMFTLLSAATMFPAYCVALCPFKTVTELPAGSSPGELVRVGIYLSVFISMVVALPLLLKRRAQCSFLCPLGALQTGANFIDPFAVKVDAKACARCGACVKACPAFAMTEESLALGRAGRACMKCGKCADVCPAGAVYFHVKGTPADSGRELARVLFLYPAFLFLAAFAGGTCVDGAARLINIFAGRLF
ncbi:MAG: 4Fe-4S binding protein [Elusimicrobia bacterium]|nr:4Fe-4S binding protein [Elusimicrobiota bacterium]